MNVPTQSRTPVPLSSADSPGASCTTSTVSSTAPSSTASPGSSAGCSATFPSTAEGLLPRHTSHERIARVAAVVLLVIICVAVVWPSGREVAELKDSLGPTFLSSEDKDVVLNLVMLAPATFCAVAGWRDIPWWMWALVGCVVGLSAEVLQSLLPMLERRPSLANVGQNAVGAWAGALAAWCLLRRLHPRPAST